MKFNTLLIAAAVIGAALLPGCNEQNQVQAPAPVQTPAPPKAKAAQTESLVTNSAVETSIKNLEAMVASKRKFEPKDEEWLKPLNDALGCTDAELPDMEDLSKTKKVNCRLEWSNLNSVENSPKLLLNTLKVMRQASNIKPAVFTLNDGSTVPVYNSELAAKMLKTYKPSDIGPIKDLLKAKGTFNITINKKNGLVKTCDIGENESANMSERQWVTDTVHAGGLAMDFEPKEFIKSTETLAKFYTNKTEQAAFDSIIANPKSYREGGPEVGVAHIFYPDTLERDPNWNNNKRLESLGLALTSFTGLLFDGYIIHNDRGTPNPSPEVLQATANITAYLVAIDYSSAPSAGNWEEIPFEGGLTWDTTAINAALTDISDFMFNPAYDKIPGVAKVRKELKAKKHGDIFKDSKAINEAIERGIKRVQKTYMAESPGHREKDSSLAFIAAHCPRPCTLDSDPIKSAEKHLQLLEMLEKNLVRDQGMIRYAPFNMTLNDGEKVKVPDSYLNFNYNIACDANGRINIPWFEIMKQFGAFDASDPKVFASRAKMSTPDCEAQWFMVSDLGCGYSMVFRSIYDLAKERASAKGETKVTLTEDEIRIVKTARAGADRNLNRALARITPEKQIIKANGELCPAWAVPEAWQCVSSLDGSKVYLPGVHTPLTWAKASLYILMNYHGDNLSRLEENDLMDLTDLYKESENSSKAAENK